MSFCHNCGTQLAESAKFCPSCGTAYQETQPIFQETVQLATIPVPVSQPIQSTPSNPIHQNVIVMGTQKSVGLAFLLAFLFGPLGLLYSSIVGGIVMFFVDVFFAIIFFPALIFGQIACIIWACVAASQANNSMMNKGNTLIKNEFQK